MLQMLQSVAEHGIKTMRLCNETRLTWVSQRYLHDKRGDKSGLTGLVKK
ncbi:hypothetical protein O9992_17355 [Vibrio lentus]|nr:hypothetical protein [Vibrio lentus]